MFEQLLPLLFAAVVFLLSMLVERLKARQRQPPQEARSPLPPVPPRVPTPLPPRVPTPLPPRVMPSPVSLEESPRTTVPPVPPARAPRSRPQRSLGDRHDIRRGIVLMTLLGPCRALEPPPGGPGNTTQGA